MEGDPAGILPEAECQVGLDPGTADRQQPDCHSRVHRMSVPNRLTRDPRWRCWQSWTVPRLRELPRHHRQRYRRQEPPSRSMPRGRRLPQLRPTSPQLLPLWPRHPPPTRTARCRQRSRWWPRGHCTEFLGDSTIPWPRRRYTAHISYIERFLESATRRSFRRAVRRFRCEWKPISAHRET